MMPTKPVIVVAALGLLLGGCANSGLTDMLGGGKSTTPREASVQQGSSLSMPPDLQLRAPSGNATEEYQPNTAAVAPAPAPDETQVAAIPQAPAAKPAPAQDVYTEYGVSKTNPDGTEKSKGQLENELKAAMLARKRQKNPRYGTVMNIGNIFSDE